MGQLELEDDWVVCTWLHTKGLPWVFIYTPCLDGHRLKDDQALKQHEVSLWDSAASVMRWQRVTALSGFSDAQQSRSCWLDCICLLINHNDVNKNACHQGPLWMNSNLLQYLGDLLRFAQLGSIRNALHVIDFTSFSPVQLLWSKEKRL